MSGEYPEREKLHAVQDQTQAAGEFLEWLRNTGREICVLDRYDGYRPTGFSTERLLAEWQGIDLHRLEQEKQQMLEEQRALVVRREAEDAAP